MSLQIVEFIAAIKQAKSDKEIAEICNLECNRLREIYALTAFKRALSRYRNAIKTDLTDMSIPLSIMRLTQEESAKIEHDYSLKVREDRSNLVPLDPDKMILKGEELCSADGYLKNCLGLMLLTGRRNYEILKGGQFFTVRDIDKAIEYAKNTLSESTVNDCESILSQLAKLDCDNALLFVGQAKTSGSDSTVKQPYPIPILSDADWILAIFNQFRTKLENGKKPTISELDYDAIHNRVSKPLNDKKTGCKHPKNFGELLPPNKCHSHNLRSAYATICAHFYKPETVDLGEFYSWILGHGATSIATTESYKDFYVPE
jgi:hypothetical protein